MSFLTLQFNIKKTTIHRLAQILERYAPYLLTGFLAAISVLAFIYYYTNGLGLAYNDARSHLDIGRRVVEGLKPGLAQLGSVWLPLPHALMIPTIWNDFMWHTGLSGAIQSMISFVVCGLLIYSFLHTLGVGLLGRAIGVLIFVVNVNILYLQSTAMNELLLLAMMTSGVLEFVMWTKRGKLLNLIKSSFFIMLSTLIRYDGWFLFLYASALLGFIAWKKYGYKVSEGMVILFCTLAGVGIVFWVLWNQLIFKDALYFIYGPFSAHAQQKQLADAGVLATKGNLLFSLQVYLYALMYNTGAFTAILGALGAIALMTDRKIPKRVRVASSALIAPFLFNVIALYLGHSVLFIQGLSGNTWFNARYGSLMIPSIAVFIGYLVHRVTRLRLVIIGLLAFTAFFSIANGDAVTIDDATVGSSQKNVTEVSGYLRDNAKDEKGFILISAASHDAIIFSSGLPMKRFIHEGTGAYWENATTGPEHWARWIVMRTNDTNDLVFKTVSKTPGYSLYEKQASYPFADVYELKPEYRNQLNTEPILGKQK